MSATSPRQRSGLAIVYLTVFIDLLGFGIILPLLPYYALRFGATGVLVGILMTSYSAAQFIGAPIVGRLSDLYGRRPVILWTLFGSALSFCITGVADSLLVLILARTTAGLFGGSIAAAQAYIADVTKPEERSKYMGLLGAAIGMGFVFGPAIGAALAPQGLGSAAFVAAGLAFGNLVFALLRLKESLGKDQPRPTRQRLSLAVGRRVFANEAMATVIAASFAATFAFVAMETTYALLGAQHYALGPRQLGYAFTFLGAIVVLVQGGLIGPLTKRWGERSMATLGFVLMGLGLAVVPAMPTALSSALALALLATGQALTTPSLSALTSRLAQSDEQGGTLGISQSAQALARGVSPLIAGSLYDLRYFAPYAFAALVCICAGFMLRRSQSLGLKHAAPEPNI